MVPYFFFLLLERNDCRMIENFDNLITLTFVKENLYDVGEKKDFTIIDSITKATFKATIIAICDYEYADKESSIKTIWFDAFNIENFKEEDLYEEPHYIVKLHEDFTTHKKGEELIIPQLFIDTDKTKDSEDETFAIYIEMNLESNHKEYQTKDDVINAIKEFIDSKKIKSNIRLLKEYDEKDLESILESLRYFVKVDKTDEEIKKSVINLLRGATKKEIMENAIHSRRYEVYFSATDSRTVICTPLIKFNRKDIIFSY